MSPPQAAAAVALQASPPSSRSGFAAERHYRLSSHAQLRPTGSGGLIAECLSTGAVLPLINSTQVTLTLSFLEATRPADLLEQTEGEKRQALHAFFEHLHTTGLLSRVDNEGRALERDPGLESWEPHDLYFHLRSRRGRTPFTVGGTYHRRSTSPEPALKTPARSLAVSWPKRASSASRPGLSLTEALETRRSKYNVEPIDSDQLGEFLYRTSRITDVRTTAQGETLLRRVYPSGGGFHCLELYVVTTRCSGIDRGLYHYRPLEHGLVSMHAENEHIDALLEEARKGTGRLESEPPVLFIFSARFQRMTRKYQGLAYSLILKEVGAAFQTFYLVAADMGLGGCAIGTGDTERFCQATRTDFFRESSVGEFILGGGRR
ncbi:MAG: SagB family peptide dehydrogenase [Acidobacteriota bacterium]